MESQDPESLIFEWCALEDFHSGGMVYDREEFLEDQAGYEPDPDPEQSDSPQVQSPKRREALPIKIDPMDPATLGSGRVSLAQSNLRKNGYLTPAETLEPLLSADAFYSRCVVIGPKPKPAPKKDTRVPRANVEDLKEWGLIATVILSAVVCFGMLFTVPKPSTGTHRVIFDGRPGNALLARPPYFRFFQPIDLVSALRGLGEFTASSWDIRHFFYRLSLPAYIGVFYALMLVSGLFIPTQVPMGSTHGPAWASAFAFCVVAYREQHESALGLHVPAGIIPTVLEIIANGAVVGYIWIVIDNILLATSDPELTKKWRTRIERNGRQLGVHPWKESFKWDQDHLQFTGILYEKGKWRHAEDRIIRWTDRHGENGVSPPVEPTPRAGSTRKIVSQATEVIQKMVGVLVWNCRLRGLHMRNLRSCFGIQTRTGAGQPTTPEEWNTLNRTWAAHIANPWSQWDEVSQWPPAHAGRPKRILVTDASDTKWSWLELVGGKVKQSPSGVDENPSGYFDETVRQWKIYYKELITVVLMLQALDSDGVTDVDIVLVGDSKAVIGSLKKMMGPERSWEMLDVVWTLVKKNRWGLQFIWVESAGNVAHSATHDEAIEAYRVQRSWVVATTEGYPIERPFPKRRRNEE
jgi:hypothetical protein